MNTACPSISSVQDKINRARYFTEAAFMAAFGVGSDLQTSALQTVIGEIEDLLVEVNSALETMKGKEA